MVAGVALGVAVVVAIDLANSSALSAFELSTEAVTGRATHAITGAAGGLDEAVYVRLRTDPALDVRASAPVIEGWVSALQLDGQPMRVLGVDPLAEPPFRGFLGPGPQAGGSAAADSLAALMARRDTVLVSEAVARRAGVSEGGWLDLQVGPRRARVEVVGVLEPRDALAERALDGIIIADIGNAQTLLGKVGRIDRIDLILPPAGEDREAMLATLRGALPPQAAIEPASAQIDAVASMTAAFRLNLLALSLLALLVGSFLIFNTVRFGVVQRRPALATLRALGVTRREVFGLILGETLVLGLVGALIGLGLGVLLGRSAVDLVSRTINDIYFVSGVRSAQLSAGSLARGAVLGVVAALAAAVLPAWEATAISPIEARRRSGEEREAKAGQGRGLLLAIVFVVVGAAILALSGDSAAWGFAALGTMVFAFALGAPAFTTAAMRVVGPILDRSLGITGRLAPRGVVGALSRTGVAIAALMVALSVSIGVSLMVGSFRLTVIDWLGTTLRADVFVSPAGTGSGSGRADQSLPPGLAERLSSTPGVADLSTARAVGLRSPELGVVDVLAVRRDIAGGQRRYLESIGSAEDVRTALEGGAIAISEPLMRSKGVRLGDAIGLLTESGPREFPVVAVFYDYGSSTGVAFMDDAVYRAGWPSDEAVTSIALSLEEGVDGPAWARELERSVLATDGLFVTVQPTGALRREVLDVFDRAFAITGALQLLAIAIAFAGVLSALMALQLERSREHATLRATGMTSGQIAGLSMLQSGLMGAAAGVLSWPAGLVLAMVLIYVINRRSFGWTIQTHFALEPFAQALALAVAAALLAGAYPAWRLSRLRIATALREE